MGITESQANDVWNDAFEAEVRSLYFADLGARYTRRQQIITGVSFFLASGAAATIVGDLPGWVPTLLSTLTAIIMAYSMAVGLDKKAATMAKLHYLWHQVRSDYMGLWNRWYEDSAGVRLEEIRAREREASQLSITDGPYNERLIQKWQKFVKGQHKTKSA